MRKTLLTAAAATMLWTQANAAVSVKVGYSSIVGELTFNQNDPNAPATSSGQTTKTEDVSAGVVTFGGEVSAPVTDMFSIGFEVGSSMSGEFEFDKTKEQVAPATGVNTGVNPATGDKDVFELAKVPVLAKAAVNFALGPGTATLGLGVGAILISWNQESTDQRWWDGTTWSYAGTGSKTVANAVAHSKNVTNSTGTANAFAFEIAPAYHYKINSKSSIGLEIPLQFVSETIIMGSHQDFEAVAPAPNPALPDPSYVGGGQMMIGGMEWGVNVVYTINI